jgi:hypothetical protein
MLRIEFDSQTIKTIWDELVWQLGGAEALACRRGRRYATFQGCRASLMAEK